MFMFHLNHFIMLFADSLYVRNSAIQLCRYMTVEIICYTPWLKCDRTVRNAVQSPQDFWKLRSASSEILKLRSEPTAT